MKLIKNFKKLIPQYLYNQDGKLATEAEIRSVIMDAKTKRGVYPEGDFVRAIVG